MSKRISKTETQKQIQEFFSNIKTKTSKEVKKIKKLAMSKNIPLKEKKRLFCKKCLSPYINPKIRIKNNIKIIFCQNCDSITRRKII